MKSNLHGLVISFVLAGLICVPTSSQGAGFGPGNVVALRAGDGSAALTTTATKIFLDEYQSTVSSALVRSVDITSSATPNQICCVGTYGSGNFEGGINLSQDGQYIIVGGYNCAVGTAGISATSANTIPRVMGRVKISDLTVDSSIQITTSAVSGNIRCATSTNGTDFYAAMYNQSTFASNIYYTNSGMAGDAVGVMAPSTGTSHALRGVGIFNGQLYATLANLGAGNPNGLFSIGTGVPTTANNPLTSIISGVAPFQNMIQFAFESYVPSVSGRVWIADQVAADALTKWDYNGSIWTKTANMGTMTLSCYGVALGKDSSGNDVTFVTPASTSPNTLRMVNRNTSVVTTVATSPANTNFRGVVYIPTSDVGDWAKY